MDDRQVGKILSRREILALFRATGTAILVVGCTSRHPNSAQASNTQPATSVNAALPRCIVSPEQTEGPYFVDEKLNRSDIRRDPSDGTVTDGLPLNLKLRVSKVGNSGCTPVAGAIVDIWHCDALGVYSDVVDRSFNTVGKKFLRGYQVTDTNGVVQFVTIYPGWYQGRTTHIHFKVRAPGTSGQNYEFTSQLYFDDAISDRVYTQTPYSSKGKRTEGNEQDGIFQRGGEQLMLSLAEDKQGYAATFDIGLQMA